MKKLTFIVTFQRGGFENDYRVQAPNRASARAKVKDAFEGCKILNIREELTPVQKALTEAATQGQVRVGVQKSLQMGYSDLPLFGKDEQLKLF